MEEIRQRRRGQSRDRGKLRGWGPLAALRAFSTDERNIGRPLFQQEPRIRQHPPAGVTLFSVGGAACDFSDSAVGEGGGGGGSGGESASIVSSGVLQC